MKAPRALTMAAMLFVGCGAASSGAGTQRGRAPQPRAADACAALDHVELGAVAGLRGVAFLPGERYPASHACVWWSATLPVHSVEVAFAETGAMVRVCRYDDGGRSSHLAVATERVREAVGHVSVRALGVMRDNP